MLVIIATVGFVLFVATGIIGAVFFSLKKTSEVGNEALQKQAIKRHGRIIKPGLLSIEFTKPKLEFFHNDTKITVFPGQDKMAFRFDWRPMETFSSLYIIFSLSLKKQYLLEILPHSLMTKCYEMAGIENIRLGNPEFEKIYSVKTNDVELTRRLLTNDILSLLINCLEYSEYNYKFVNPAIKIKNGQFLLKLPTLPRNDQNLDRLIDISIAFCDIANKL